MLKSLFDSICNISKRIVADTYSLVLGLTRSVTVSALKTYYTCKTKGFMACLGFAALTLVVYFVSVFVTVFFFLPSLAIIVSTNVVEAMVGGEVKVKTLHNELFARTKLNNVLIDFALGDKIVAFFRQGSDSISLKDTSFDHLSRQHDAVFEQQAQTNRVNEMTNRINEQFAAVDNQHFAH